MSAVLPCPLLCRVYLETLPYSHRTDSSKPEDVKESDLKFLGLPAWITVRHPPRMLCAASASNCRRGEPRGGLGRSYLARRTRGEPLLGKPTFIPGLE